MCTPWGSASDGTFLAVADASSAIGGPGGRTELVLDKLLRAGTAVVRLATRASGCWLSEPGWGMGMTVDRHATPAACAVRRDAPGVWLADAGGTSGW